MFGSESWLSNQQAGFYNGVATQSLRFNDDDEAYLSRTPSSASNQKTWTYSTWFKIANTSVNHTIWSAGATGTPRVALYLSSGGQLITDLAGTGSYDESVALFRDVSAWYHLVWVFDTTQATGSNRSRIYINGTEITLTKTRTWSLNTDYAFNGTVLHSIGGLSNSLTAFSSDKYQAETNFVDGTALDPTSFGETKNGVWIPIEYTGSYGTNGFRLEFKNTSVGSGSSSTIGADTSGNANHFSSSGIVASDCNMPDSPENNFCTFNSVGRRYGQSYVGTFSEGNLSVDTAGQSTHVWGTMAINQIASQGGVYFEIRMDSLDTARTEFGVIGDNGSNNKSASSNGAGYSFPIKGLINDDPRAFFTTATDGSSVDLTANTAFSNGDVAGIAILSDGKFFCHRNGTYLQNSSGNTGNPSTGTNEIATIDLTLGDWVPFVGFNSSFSINFGQDGSFSGNETSGGYQDANGIGDFMFSVPTNCLAICSSNMAEPTISPNETTQADDYFNTVIYDGNNDATRTFDVGFVSDFSWFKARSGAGYGHQLFDSVRGVQLRLRSNDTSAEATNSEGVLDFDDNGLLKIGTDAFLNESGTTMVIWNWKAGGTAVSNTDGSITSSVSANTDAGFSIVSYTGTGANATVGHGLNVAPNMIIVKNRNDSASWAVFSEEAGNGYWLLLNENFSKQSTTTMWNSTSPTSTVFSIGSANESNGSSDNMIAYCFHDVEGYSKFGGYTGNGLSDGPMIFTSFRPAMVIIKQTNSANNWRIIDDKRDGYNGSTKVLYPSVSNAEGAEVGADLVSNGFKLRADTAGTNASGGTFIYMAFAENPFKYANAR